MKIYLELLLQVILLRNLKTCINFNKKIIKKISEQKIKGFKKFILKILK